MELRAIDAAVTSAAIRPTRNCANMGLFLLPPLAEISEEATIQAQSRIVSRSWTVRGEALSRRTPARFKGVQNRSVFTAFRLPGLFHRPPRPPAAADGMCYDIPRRSQDTGKLTAPPPQPR